MIEAIGRIRERRRARAIPRSGAGAHYAQPPDRRFAVHEAAVACLLCDRAGIITEANPVAHRLLGRAPHTLTGLALQDAGLSLPDVNKALPDEPLVVDFRHPDGRILALECAAGRVTDEGGSSEGVAWWVSDVTARRDAEVALEAARQRIRQGERLETLGTLAGGLAHDFNNLLAPIVGNVDLVLLDTPAGSTRFEDLETVRMAAERASELASRLLHLSRPERDNVEPVLVQDIMAEALALLSSSPGQNLTVVEQLDPNCPPIRGTRTQLHQVLFNLCKNALQAMPGGGTLSVTVEFTAQLATRRNLASKVDGGGFVRVIIADTGTGMSAETVERVFEPFFSTKAEGSGSGLGLAMVKSIVSGWGGSIDLSSTLGKGTRFTLVLPAFRQSGGASDTERESGRGHVGPETGTDCLRSRDHTGLDASV